MLVLNGADDPFVKPEQIGAFKQEMTLAKVDFRFVDYPGAVHAFTNPEATEAGKKFEPAAQVRREGRQAGEGRGRQVPRRGLGEVAVASRAARAR